jgi:tRNA(fMet)-specific endonuclease VapC
MKYLVDSDVAADALKGQTYATDFLRRLERDRLALSIISYIELREEILGSSNRAAHERGFRAFLRRMRVLTISRAVADRAATIRSYLRSHKQPVSQRALDLLIAATALEHGLILITRNRRDYADVPGLALHPSV